MYSEVVLIFEQPRWNILPKPFKNPDFEPFITMNILLYHAVISFTFWYNMILYLNYVL